MYSIYLDVFRSRVPEMAGVGFMRPDIISGPRREERALPYPPLCPESGDGLGRNGEGKGEEGEKDQLANIYDHSGATRYL